MNKIKKLRLYIVSLLLSAFALSSCIAEALIPNNNDESEITIVIDMPGTAASRAIGSTDDTVIDRIDVLIFDLNNGGRYVGRVSPVFGINQTSQSFTVKAPKGNLELAIFANAKDRIDAATFTVGTTTKAQAYTQLTESLPFNNIWNADPQDPGYKPFPMWGEVAVNTNTATTASVTLVRALAKINIRFLNPTISSKLEITEISLYNYHTNGYLASWASPNTPTHISNKREGYVNGIYFSSTLIDNNQMMDEIFLFEVAPPANPSNPAIADRVASTCVIIRGHFEGSAADSYYRVDLKSPAGVYYGVTRNNNYDIVIQDVFGSGANTGEIAYDSELVDITATVLQWDLGAEMDVDYSGQYRLVTSSSAFQFVQIASSQTLKIFSDAPGGWKIEGKPDWITLDWNAGDENNTVDFVDIIITCNDNSTSSERRGEFYVVTGLLKKKITVNQTYFHFAPPGVLGVTESGKLTLRGSNTYAGEAAINTFAVNEFGGLEDEAVYLALFKFGSLIAINASGSTYVYSIPGDMFDATRDILWAPAEFNLSTVTTYAQVSFTTINGELSTTPSLTAGTGDPCLLADKGTSGFVWRTPTDQDSPVFISPLNTVSVGNPPNNGRFTTGGAGIAPFLTFSGFRNADGSLVNQSSYGTYWSRTGIGNNARYFNFLTIGNNGAFASGSVSFGGAVRCVSAGITQSPPSPMTICPNETNTISLAAVTGQSGITYRWEMSTDNTTWTPAPAPNNAQNYVIAAGMLTANTYFRRVAIWNGTEYPSDAALISLPTLGIFPNEVNLGGITWSTRNVDLSTSSGFVNHPGQPGMLFQWNRNVGWSAENPLTSSDGSLWDNSSPGTSDWINEPCPAGWRLPNELEIGNLGNLPRKWLTSTEAASLGFGCAPGFLFGTNNLANFDPNNHLFLISGSTRDNFGAFSPFFGGYWAMGTSSTNRNFAMTLGVNNNDGSAPPMYGNFTASFALSVRCVKEGVEIDGVRWAESNVDATQVSGFASTPADYGSFFQYNRNTAYNNGTALQTWSTTTWGTGTWQAGSWNNSEDTGSAWQTPANDPCPADWRLPTQAEFQQLLDNSPLTGSVRGVWTAVGGVNGRCFGPGAAAGCSSSNALFLPAAGVRSSSNGALLFAGTDGHYWSSTFSGLALAMLLYFDSGIASVAGSVSRAAGFSVRCVAE
ncbi:MAG: hypothetical protein LBI15_06980 [Dysgonamonadaceae bacterium]|jgi:uncharacterized protein (TIGR02145 family)|nr:hypothetical protein [Dysgonamonadaceae bacterium]